MKWDKPPENSNKDIEKMSFEVMYADQGLAQNEPQGPMGDGMNAAERLDLANCEYKFMHFLQETQERNTFIYR